MKEFINSIKYIIKLEVLDKIKYNSKEINQSPWIVLGNQKSGTTAIAKLISIATNKSLTADFIRAIQRPTLSLELAFNLLSFKDFMQLYKYEFSKDIIKEPFLTYHTEILLKNLPEANYLFIVRNPFQNIRSILNRLKIPGNLEQIDLQEWEELNKTPVWKLSLQSEMLGIGSKNYIEAMAIRWNYIADAYFRKREQYILVKYENFMLDKKNYILNLCNKLNLDVVSDITNKIDVQFQPQGIQKVDLSSFYGETNYNLIYSICEKNLTKLGYK